MTIRNHHFNSAPAAENLTLDGIISETSGLVSAPRIGMHLHQLIKSKHATANKIGKAIELDPNLTARILKLVNSAAYGYPRQIASVARAVTIVGTSELCNLIMAILAVRCVSRLGGGLFSLNEFWRHSVFVALCSRALARQCKLPHTDAYFIAGLLHDTGIPILYSSRPALADSFREHFSHGESELALCERMTLGFDHAEVGGRLLESWHLPVFLTQAIAAHHQSSRQPAAAILQIADHLAHASNKQHEHGLTRDLSPEVWQPLPVEEKSVNLQKIIDTVAEQQTQVIQALVSH